MVNKLRNGKLKLKMGEKATLDALFSDEVVIALCSKEIDETIFLFRRSTNILLLLLLVAFHDWPSNG
jgi:hypothetical protein